MDPGKIYKAQFGCSKEPGGIAVYYAKLGRGGSCGISFMMMWVVGACGTITMATPVRTCGYIFV